MRQLFLLFCLVVMATGNSWGQDISGEQTDSVTTVQPAIQTATVDSLVLAAVPDLDSCRRYIIKQLLRLNTSAAGVFQIQAEKYNRSKDWLFYYITALLLLFGMLRLSYPRYFHDLFRFFFRTSLRVNQIREQLVQSGLQSLLFNIFFALSFGVYIYLISLYFQSDFRVEAWLIPLAGTLALLVLYGGKYLFLQLSGWLFGISQATETYAFIVFLINKVAGIAILPFLLILAFAELPVAQVALTISLAIVAFLFLYRFLRAYQPVQTHLQVSRLHFMIFFLAVEIAPLLLIYKLLVRFF